MNVQMKNNSIIMCCCQTNYRHSAQREWRSRQAACAAATEWSTSCGRLPRLAWRPSTSRSGWLWASYSRQVRGRYLHTTFANLIQLKTPSGNYELKEQYFIYDGNALIADIGGYFCMFLSLNRFLIGTLNFLKENVKKKFCSRKNETKAPRAKVAWVAPNITGDTNIKDIFEK